MIRSLFLGIVILAAVTPAFAQPGGWATKASANSTEQA